VMIRIGGIDSDRGMLIFLKGHGMCVGFEVYTLARCTKKDRPRGDDLRAGECLDSVASGRTSLDHRGDSPELENPVGVIPLGGTLHDAFTTQRLKERCLQSREPRRKGKYFLCHKRFYCCELLCVSETVKSYLLTLKVGTAFPLGSSGDSPELRKDI
jgi:hypothetical protein